MLPVESQEHGASWKGGACPRQALDPRLTLLGLRVWTALPPCYRAGYRQARKVTVLSRKEVPAMVCQQEHGGNG